MSLNTETMSNTIATVNMIADFAESPSDTFNMLKGVLIAGHSLDETADTILRTLIDMQLIAAAMDYMNQGNTVKNGWDVYNWKKERNAA